ncbi:MAG: PTS fructose transporter subunit IIA [Betaproteobacteria bacterium]|nr:PTS fructose transporter subunit IIA [Betaproteobacteria bacterium]
MIGILIISHGSLGESLIQAAGHVLGTSPRRLRHLAVESGDDPEILAERGRALVREIDDGSGVLLLADVYGATPGNVARGLIEPGRVEGIAGVSLPMLLRALTYCGSPLALVVDKALSGGREGVVHIPREPGNG